MTCLAEQTGPSCLSEQGCMAQVNHASVLALCQLADTVHCECIMQSRASRQLRSQCFTRSRYSSVLTRQPIMPCCFTNTSGINRVISLNYIFIHKPGHAMLCMHKYILVKQPMNCDQASSMFLFLWAWICTIMGHHFVCLSGHLHQNHLHVRDAPHTSHAVCLLQVWTSPPFRAWKRPSQQPQELTQPTRMAPRAPACVTYSQQQA